MRTSPDLAHRLGQRRAGERLDIARSSLPSKKPHPHTPNCDLPELHDTRPPPHRAPTLSSTLLLVSLPAPQDQLCAATHDPMRRRVLNADFCLHPVRLNRLAAARKPRACRSKSTGCAATNSTIRGNLVFRQACRQCPITSARLSVAFSRTVITALMTGCVQALFRQHRQARTVGNAMRTFSISTGSTFVPEMLMTDGFVRLVSDRRPNPDAPDHRLKTTVAKHRGGHL